MRPRTAAWTRVAASSPASDDSCCLAASLASATVGACSFAPWRRRSKCGRCRRAILLPRALDWIRVAAVSCSVVSGRISEVHVRTKDSTGSVAGELLQLSCPDSSKLVTKGSFLPLGADSVWTRLRHLVSSPLLCSVAGCPLRVAVAAAEHVGRRCPMPSPKCSPRRGRLWTACSIRSSPS